MLMVMDNNVPPAPPPYQPNNSGKNPYDFITNHGSSNKNGFTSSNSKKTRILITVGFISVLLIVGVLFWNFLSNSNGSLKNDYISLVQQQTEIIRVSEIGIKESRDSDTKNLALTTKLSLTSSQTKIINMAKKIGADTSKATIALGKDPKTDALLTAASQNNKFDEVFNAKLTEMLVKYQQTIKSIFEQTSNKSSKETLNKAHANALLLTKNE